MKTTLRMGKKNEQGFTLVELMIVVAIIGILAVLAIYGVSRYMTNAKTGEARNSLGQIAKGATAAYEEEHGDDKLLKPGDPGAGTNHVLCISAADKVPATLQEDKKYQSNGASDTDWQKPIGAAAKTEGWPCLKFSLTEPQYFQYGYKATPGANFVATADADFKADGATAATVGFNITGKIVSGQLTVAQQIKEFVGAADETIE